MDYLIEKRPMQTDDISIVAWEHVRKNGDLQMFKSRMKLSSCPHTEEEAAELLTKGQFNFLSHYITDLKSCYDEGETFILEAHTPDGYKSRDAFLAVLAKYLYVVNVSFYYYDVATLVALEKSFKEGDKADLATILEQQFLFLEINDLTEGKDFEAFRILLRKRMDRKMPTFIICDVFLGIAWPPATLNFFNRHLIANNRKLSF